MAKIVFKTKVMQMSDMEGNLLYEYVVVPKFGRQHCDMNAFRRHAKYGGLANSDMFIGVLARIRSDLLNGALGLRLDQLPSNVSIDTSKYLAEVTIEV